MFAPEASFNLAMLKTATDIAIAIYKLLSASSFPGHILDVHYIDVKAGVLPLDQEDTITHLRPKPKARVLGSGSIGLPFSPKNRSGLKVSGSW